MSVDVVKSLKRRFEEESCYEFELQHIVHEKVSSKRLLRKYDLGKLPTILRLTQKGARVLEEYYNCWNWPRKEIDWEKDWRDDNPTFIDYVEVWSDKVLVGTLGEFPIDFMTWLYYGIPEIIFEPKEEIYTDKGDRMKLARYVPAAVKDIEVAIKTIVEVSASSGLNASDFKFDSEHGLFSETFLNSDFCIKSEFSTRRMDEQEIIKTCMERAKTISEWRWRFRAWLPSMERRQFYESTKTIYEVRMLKRGSWHWTGVEGLVKWPVKDKKAREEITNHHIYRFLDHGAHLFTFDGYGIVGYRINNEYKFKFWVDRKQKKFQRLNPIPLEKIEFLKEDFPEMFK